jgi:hypothetical protein
VSRRALTRAALGLVVMLVPAACGGGGASTAYCDTVQVQLASVDPLSEPSVRTDPARLEEAFRNLVQAYGLLARLAPKDVQDAAGTVRDGVIRVSNALAAKGWDASQPNPELDAALDDQGYADALVELRRFNQRECGVG